jgi:hypothetical protein
MPGDSGVLVVTRVRSTTTKCTRGRGCNGHPAFPTPSLGRKINAQLGRIAPRDREAASGIVLLLESFEVGVCTKRYLTPCNTTHPSCPDLIRASINLRDNFFRRRWITGSSSAKTRFCPVTTISIGMTVIARSEATVAVGTPLLHHPPRRFPIIEKARQAATDDTLGIRHDTVDQFLHGRNVLDQAGVFCVRPVIMPRPPVFETAAASSANPT